MGCGVSRSRPDVSKFHVVEPNNNEVVRAAKVKDKDSNDEKREKMLRAAEERETKQKLHGMSEAGQKNYEEKLKRQKKALKDNQKDNYEPLNWNS